MYNNNSMMNEAAPVQQPPPPPPHQSMMPAPITAALSRCGRFIQYKVLGNVFEVTSKYNPPIVAIGRGAYGVVYSALNTDTNEKVAIKKILRPFDTEIDAMRTLREIKLLRYMEHENVIAIKDIIPPTNRESFNDVYIGYELMDTDLHQVIHSDPPLSDQHCQYFLYQILRGLKYLHSANVLHRDLKPSNLLLNANCDLKICDFGLARVVSENDILTDYVVTRWYRAPELLLSASANYTAAVDIWAVGCIFMEMIKRRPLFSGKDPCTQIHLMVELLGKPSEAEMECLGKDAKRFLRSLPFIHHCPLTVRFPQINPLAADLVEKMLSFDPRRRIKVEDALAHPYLATLHDISDEPACTVPFYFDFKQGELTKAQIKEMIYREALAFNPEYNERM